MWQGFGSWRSQGAPTGRSPCCTQSLPASFRMDPSQAKAEPISKVVGTPVYLKSRGKLQSKEKSEKKGAQRGKEENTSLLVVIPALCVLCHSLLHCRDWLQPVLFTEGPEESGMKLSLEKGAGKKLEIFTVCANLHLFASQYLYQ